jgi:hypothetical protein
MKPNVLHSVVVAVLCCCTDLLVPRSSSALTLSRLTSVAPRLPGNGDSGFGRRAWGATGTAHHCRGHPAEEGAHGRADENVARVVDAGVHAGKCHDRRCATQRKLERRQQGFRRQRRTRRRTRSDRTKRRRRGHGDPSLLRYAESVPVGAVAFADHFHGLVHHQGRCSYSREPCERSTSAMRPAEQGEEASRDESWLGEVGEARHSPQRLVQQWGAQPRH